MFQRKQAGADYRLVIDFETFRAGDDSLRERLLVRNIIEAIRDLSRKAGKRFRGDDLINDILQLFSLESEGLGKR